MVHAPDKLPERVREILVHTDTEVFLSQASIWELAIKFSAGKLSVPQPFDLYVRSRLQRDDVQVLAIANAHVIRVATMPSHHRDPFDRLLIVQSQIEEIPIISADRVFAAYDVEVLWD